MISPLLGLSAASLFVQFQICSVCWCALGLDLTVFFLLEKETPEHGDLPSSVGSAEDTHGCLKRGPVRVRVTLYAMARSPGTLTWDAHDPTARLHRAVCGCNLSSQTANVGEHTGDRTWQERWGFQKGWRSGGSDVTRRQGHGG
jgi:hypothetical protein